MSVRRPTVEIPPALGSEDRAWRFLLTLSADADAPPWVLVGGLMVRLHLHAAGRQPRRQTRDADVLVDLRAGRGGPSTMAALLVAHYELHAQASGTDERLHRFTDRRDDADRLIVDVLGPDLEGADLRTIPPGRTVAVPDGRAMLRDAERVQVRYDGKTGALPLPPLGRAVIAKWRAWTELVGTRATRGAGVGTLEMDGRDRHLTDIAELLAAVTDPAAAAAQMRSTGDGRRLAALASRFADHQRAWRQVVEDPELVLDTLAAIAALHPSTQ